MGLLGDSWDDPKTMATMQLAAGLLGGGNFGQAAARGLAGYQAQMTAAQEQEMRRQYMQAQRENMASEIEARKLAQRKYEEQQKVIQSVFGGGGQQSQPGSAMPSGGGMPTQMQRNSVLGNLTPDDVARLKLAGVDIGDIYKYANDPLKLDPGSTYRDKMTGQERTIPKLPDGGSVVGGRFQYMPGYVEAQARLAGDTAGATAAAQSGYKLTTVYDPVNKRQVMVPESYVTNQGAPSAPGVPGGYQGGANQGNARMTPELEAFIRQQAINDGVDNPTIRFDAPIPGQTLGLTGVRSGAPSFGVPTGPSSDEKNTSERIGASGKAVDESFAKDYVPFATGGGATAAKQLAQLDTVIKRLNDPSSGVTGKTVGLMPDPVLRLTNPAAVDTRQTLEDVVQGSLRQILGAQYTEKEGAGILARAYDPGLSQKENAVRVANLKMQLQQALEAKQSAAAYFEKNGTLQGWTGKLWSASDFNKNAGGATGEWGGQSAKPPVPMKGMVRGGYKFKGGDPSNPSNWEKM